jgi:hypothetical protein
MTYNHSLIGLEKNTLIILDYPKLQYTIIIVNFLITKILNNKKLDGVGPVDNRPLTN